LPFPWLEGYKSKNKRRRIDLDELKKENTNTYPYQRLLERPLPKGVDPKRLEVYLSEDDFFNVFQMKRAQFAKLPEWMQKNKKTDVNMF